MLALIARRAQEITGSEIADIAWPVPGTGSLVVEFSLRGGRETRQGLVVPLEGTLSGEAYVLARPVAAAAPSDGEPYASDAQVAGGPGPAVVVPMGTEGLDSRGTVLLARFPGEPAFTEGELEPLLAYAGQAALALELAERRRDAEQLALLQERDWIARDLHGLAVQRLFVTGMTLQSAIRLVQHEGAADRVGLAVDDLNKTIKIIRSTIFGLRARDHGAG